MPDGANLCSGLDLLVILSSKTGRKNELMKLPSIAPTQDEWHWKEWSHTAPRIQIAPLHIASSGIVAPQWTLDRPSVEIGIVGLGSMVEGALRAFHLQFRAGRRFAE